MSFKSNFATVRRTADHRLLVGGQSKAPRQVQAIHVTVVPLPAAPPGGPPDAAPVVDPDAAVGGSIDAGIGKAWEVPVGCRPKAFPLASHVLVAGAAIRATSTPDVWAEVLEVISEDAPDP